jgi:hypothetical protein
MRANDQRSKMRKRRGSSLLLVVSTIGILLAFWSMAYRMTASLIRVESSLQSRQMRSEQSIHSMTALDRALTLVEVSKPTLRQKYTYKVESPDGSGKYFTVTYTPNNSLSEAGNGWTVSVSPNTPGVVLALPKPGDNPQWPPSP